VPAPLEMPVTAELVERPLGPSRTSRRPSDMDSSMMMMMIMMMMMMMMTMMMRLMTMIQQSERTMCRRRWRCL
jgi:hypothetical protein